MVPEAADKEAAPSGSVQGSEAVVTAEALEALESINFSWTSWSTCSSRTPRTFSHILESGIFWADSAGQMASDPPRNIPFSFLPA